MSIQKFDTLIVMEVCGDDIHLSNGGWITYHDGDLDRKPKPGETVTVQRPSFFCFGYPPNARDHRAGPDDPSKAEKAIVAGSGASTCWADAQSAEGTP